MNELQKTMNNYGPARRRSAAFTLIEIMVVLVVLLIGILAIVRLFPAGFLSIARTAELTAADAKNNELLDEQKSATNQQEAITAIIPGTNLPDSTLLPSLILDLAPGAPVLAGLDPWYFSNVNPIRNVIGESFRIPVPSTNTGGGFGAIYPLQFGPVENVFTAAADSILVYGSSLQRTDQSAVPSLNNPTGQASLRNESEYAIDYDNLMVAFYPRIIDPSRPVAFRQFTISYDYYVNNGGTINQQYQPNAFDPADSISTIVTVPDVTLLPNGQMPPPVWQPLFMGMYPSDPNNGNGMAIPAAPAMYMGPPNAFPPPANASFAYGMVRDSDDVARKFRLAMPNNTVEAGGIPVWSANDAYEYAWYSRQSPGNTANPGILIFNPSGHNQPLVNSSGTQPLTARVDYHILDNHVIRDDRNVPDTAPYIIALSIPYLKLGGDVLDISNPLNTFNNALNPYNGIYRDAANRTPDIIIYNVNTGQEVGDWTNQNVVPGTGVLFADNTDPTPVDQKTGILTLNTGVVTAQKLTSASLRIFYRTQKDWGTQIQKASAHYREATSPANVDFRHYYIGDGVTGSATRIYFAPCDAGKSVIVGEFYAIGNATPYLNQQFQITADQTLFDPALNLPYIDISTLPGNPTGFSAQQTGRRVTNVLGCSVKARVVWEDGLRWRHVDNDTVLVQSPGQ